LPIVILPAVLGVQLVRKDRILRGHLSGQEYSVKGVSAVKYVRRRTVKQFLPLIFFFSKIVNNTTEHYKLVSVLDAFGDCASKNDYAQDFLYHCLNSQGFAKPVRTESYSQTN